MQNDLISRSALIEILQEKADEQVGLLRNNLLFCKELVQSQPTAYDVEEIVAEIVLLDFKTHRVMRETGINSEVFEIVRVDKYVRLDEVLDIIRNGGKE